jgi:glycosyltransferase involved in cell wall biosynthesis
MNILVLSWRDPKHPLAGGAEQVMHEHMKGWVKSGHKVTLFASKMKGLAEQEVIDGIKIVRKGYQYIGVQIAAFFYYHKHKNSFDAVVDEFHGLPFFTPIFVSKPKLAVIQEIAREVWLKNPLPIPLNWIIGVTGYIGEPLIFLFYKKTPFMVGSSSTKNELIQIGIPSENITIVPHGVLLTLPPKLPKKEKKFTILFLGRLSQDKGIEDAIETFSILYKSNEDFQFWVVGSTETKSYEEKIRLLVKHLKVKNAIKFWGFVSQSQKFDLLARAHVLVNPSIREGWGLVNIEANAVGTPVVAYKSQGLVDSIKDGESGILCSRRTPQELAYQIGNLKKNKYRLSQLQKGALRWSKTFSWQRSRKQSLDLIENLA